MAILGSLVFLGIFQIITITIKMSRGYPVRRWFF